MRVALVVDDDPDLGDVIVFMLERAGFEVHLEPDGAAGLAIAATLRPDVVLLDWMMPRMSGVEVCRALRSNVELASTKVIILSARAQQDDVSQGYSAGADDYIVKPFRPKDLINRVEAVLAHPGFMAVAIPI
jgi:two-component system phosphate regulon response regulator PhoB